MGPTELRIVLSAGALALLFRQTSTLFGREFLLFDVGGVIAIAGLLMTFVVSTTRNTVALYRAEPIPGTRRG
jgi:hypothetical protein